MIGLGRVWKAVTGGRDEGRAHPLPSIPRDVAAPRATTPDGAWDAADAPPCDTRSAERFVPNRVATVLTTAGGQRVPARVINVSRTGVAVEPKTPGLDPGEVSLVGTRPVTPGRRIALGMVFLFKKPLDPKLCGPDIVL